MGTTVQEHIHRERSCGAGKSAIPYEVVAFKWCRTYTQGVTISTKGCFIFKGGQGIIREQGSNKVLCGRGHVVVRVGIRGQCNNRPSYQKFSIFDCLSMHHILYCSGLIVCSREANHAGIRPMISIELMGFEAAIVFVEQLTFSICQVGWIHTSHASVCHAGHVCCLRGGICGSICTTRAADICLFKKVTDVVLNIGEETFVFCLAPTINVTDLLNPFGQVCEVVGVFKASMPL